MLNNNRNNTIDSLRATAIIIMILTHSLVPYLSNKKLFLLWDITHFAVPIFVFCSGYLFFSKNIERKDFNSWLYIKKRLLQLIPTYYIYALIYFAILYLTKAKFFDSNFIRNSLMINGGIDINWLVLLFVQFAFLFPLLRLLILNRFLFLASCFFSFDSAIYLLFPNYSLHPTPYKLIMFLPWSLIIIYSYFFYKYKGNKKFIFWAIVAGIILFIISYIIRSSLHLSLGLFANKYPPNLYYLSYGFTIMNIMYLIFGKLKNVISAKAGYSPPLGEIQEINNLVFFISSNSYSLFFIHYIAIYLLRYFAVNQSVHWSIFFIIVTSVSLLIQILLNKSKKIFVSMN